MNRVSFLSAISSARRGEKVVYHTGLLLIDRHRGPTFQDVHAVATAAWEAYEEGRVTLTQQRIVPFVCAYIAEKL